MTEEQLTIGVALLAFALGTIIQWIYLMIVVPIAAGIVQFSLPNLGERAWKLGVVAGVTILASLLIQALVPIPLADSTVGFLVLWAFLKKWFDSDLLGALVVAIVGMFVRVLAIFALAAAL